MNEFSFHLDGDAKILLLSAYDINISLSAPLNNRIIDFPQAHQYQSALFNALDLKFNVTSYSLSGKCVIASVSRGLMMLDRQLLDFFILLCHFIHLLAGCSSLHSC